MSKPSKNNIPCSLPNSTALVTEQILYGRQQLQVLFPIINSQGASQLWIAHGIWQIKYGWLRRKQNVQKTIEETQAASVRREVNDELRSEIVRPKLNQGNRKNWKYRELEIQLEINTTKVRPVKQR